MVSIASVVFLVEKNGRKPAAFSEHAFGVIEFCKVFLFAVSMQTKWLGQCWKAEEFWRGTDQCRSYEDKCLYSWDSVNAAGMLHLIDFNNKSKQILNQTSQKTQNEKN